MGRQAESKPFELNGSRPFLYQAEAVLEISVRRLHKTSITSACPQHCHKADAYANSEEERNLQNGVKTTRHCTATWQM